MISLQVRVRDEAEAEATAEADAEAVASPVAEHQSREANYNFGFPTLMHYSNLPPTKINGLELLWTVGLMSFRRRREEMSNVKMPNSIQSYGSRLVLDEITKPLNE